MVKPEEGFYLLMDSRDYPGGQMQMMRDWPQKDVAAAVAVFSRLINFNVGCVTSKVHSGLDFN